MKKIKIILFFLGLFFLLNGGSVLADGFVINLYYNTNTGVLGFDKYEEEYVYRDMNVETSIVEFSKDQTVGDYVLKLYDENGLEFSANEFNKQDGAFKLTIPYFSIAATVKIFEKSTNKELGVADVKKYMTCNGNGICESELGEDEKNCMGDCIVQTDLVPREESNSEEYVLSEESVDSKSFLDKVIDFFKNLF